MFSENTAFQKHSKTHFFTYVKNTFFKKRCHFWFWPISAKPTIFTVFLGFHRLVQKHFWARTDSVHENARFFSLLDTNSVRQFWLKLHFSIFLSFGCLPRKHCFYRVVWPFSIFIFCFSCSNIKIKNKKCNFIFENVIFDIPTILRNTILAQLDTMCVFLNMPQNTLNFGKTVKRKSLDQFFKDNSWTSFNTKTPNSWTSF